MATGEISERMFRALCVQLIRAGKLDAKDITAAADELAAQGDDEAAHSLQCFVVHAEAQSMVDWHAERAAKRALERAQHAARKKPEGYKPEG